MDTNHEVTQILKFSDKNFKAATVKKKKTFNKQVWTRMKQMEKENLSKEEKKIFVTCS